MKKYTLLCLFVIGITASLRAQSLSFDDALAKCVQATKNSKASKNKPKQPIIIANHSVGSICPN